MGYLVIARDGDDADAPARRLAAREAHLARAADGLGQGSIVACGAIVDGDGAMVGSALVLDIDDRAALDALLADDPYTAGDVWRDVEVIPIRLFRG